jgi:glucokinase
MERSLFMSTTKSISLEEITYIPHWQKLIKTGAFMLAGDIGGTNSNFGVMEISGPSPLLCISLHSKSQQMISFRDLLISILQHLSRKYNLLITRTCWGAAGVIGRQRSHVKPTNLSVAIDTNELMRDTPLQECILINDFEAVALGIDHIAPNDVVTISSGLGIHGAQKACIGAGTGLGKVALLWSRHQQRYFPIASEGGHADCSAQNEQEYNFFTFLKRTLGNCPISWENVLSGDGISAIYRFLGEEQTYHHTAVYEEIRLTGFKPDLISRYAHEDARCRDTFTMYTTFYARCAKNFALDVLAQNGLYIAGGIAAKNVALFTEESFRNNFFMCGKQSALLRNIPLFVITDYNVSLYGAASFLSLHDQGMI